MRVSLLRHGRTTKDNIYRGQIDVPLAPEGWQQMQQAVQGLSLERVITSSLQRCCQFAHSLPDVPVHNDARLMEINFGDWDGQNTQTVWQKDQARVEAFWQDPIHISPPNGENLEQVLQRAKASLYEHLEQGFNEGITALLFVTHAGVMRALIGDMLCMAPKGLLNINLPYASLVHIDVYQNDADEQAINTSAQEPCRFYFNVEMGVAV